MTLTLKAQVRGGRLVLDEPTELPEGSEVELVLVDEGDDLDVCMRSGICRVGTARVSSRAARVNQLLSPSALPATRTSVTP